MTLKNSISEIWYTRCPVPTPVGLAVQLGLLDETFAREGIKLNSIIDSKDRAIRSSHFDHHLNYSFRHGGNVPPIRARSEGNPTRLVGITWTDEFQAIITLPSTGIKTTWSAAASAWHAGPKASSISCMPRRSRAWFRHCRWKA